MTRSLYEILKWYQLQPVTVEQLGGGEIHKTYKITTTTGGRYVLQQVAGVVSTSAIIDTARLMFELAQKGWTVAHTLPTRYGRLYHQASDRRLWRLMEYIASDPMSPSYMAWGNIGEILAKLHRDLAACTTRPHKSLAHFHDTQYHMDRLSTISARLPLEVAEIAASIRLDYKKINTLLPGDKQLIHGDPRCNNILFRDGMPLTFIDWDTLMIGTIWLDIGDALRSCVEELLYAKQAVEAPVNSFCRDYWRQSTTYGYEQFRAYALRSARIISLELAARYCCDVVEDRYFSFNTERFKTRRQSNIARLLETLKVFDVLTRLEKIT